MEAKHVVSRIPQPLEIHSTRFIKKVGNQPELFLLRISKKKPIFSKKKFFWKKKCTSTARALHVQLCSEFTALVHVYHGITVPRRHPPHPKHTPIHHTREMGNHSTQGRWPTHRHPSRHEKPKPSPRRRWPLPHVAKLIRQNAEE